MRILPALLTIAAVAACSKKAKPEVKDPGDTAVTTDKPAADPAAQQPATAVSPNLNLSSDLADACNIKANSEIPPNFDYDKVELLPEDRAVLEQVAICITTGPLAGRGLDLIGRADPRGTQEYNLGLGARRSNSVSEYLQRLGVKPPQLAETTKGDLEATGTDEPTWAKDRRVDLALRP
jgi:peptidoglycan-associated lipoprotein